VTDLADQFTPEDFLDIQRFIKPAVGAFEISFFLMDGYSSSARLRLKWRAGFKEEMILSLVAGRSVGLPSAGGHA
jgi:hypothetical protein